MADAEEPWIGLPPASGRLLVAAPSLIESTFSRTVIFLLEHDGGGTVGVILNRPSRTPVGQVLPDWHEAVSEPQVVFTGGPVLPDGALCIGALREAEAALLGRESVRVVSDELGTVDLDADVELVSSATTKLRVFAGHAGWAPAQLDSELSEGSWFVVEGSPDDVFAENPQTLWRDVLRRQGPPLSLVSTYPSEVGLN
ncbi:putative transcriptional regulator [Frankineae bacterium MT45]|nr:putative transcriptional regulator [Frankineae bacterium MT45]